MQFQNKINPEIKDLIGNLFNQYQPQKIILFGSYAYGQPTDESDIDLLIIKDTSENPIKRRVTVRHILNNTNPDFPPISSLVITPQELDVRLRRGDQFIEEILGKGVVLYGE